jgi:hypothetical protein
MATLSFDGETHEEIVTKVKRWLASLEGEAAGTPVDVIERSAELTKDALRVLAAAAPAPVAQSDLVKGLTSLGYQVTDASAKAAIDGLDALSNLTGGGVVKKVRAGQANALFEMNQAVAKQVLKSLIPKSKPKKG